jgi:cysteinyl-tRNA synthetase
MRWKSPWGWGAPGWHLECSVMSIALLGAHFDIHTGGVDHRELHHVNEIAQSEAYLNDGTPWVRYWLHNEFLQLGAQKMSKSAGGTTRLADLVAAGYHPMAYRLFLLGGHYRSQLDFTAAAVDGAQATLRRLVARVAPLRPLPQLCTFAHAAAEVDGDPTARELLDLVDRAITTDLNTPQVLAILQDALRNTEITDAGQRAIIAVCDAALGLDLATLDPTGLQPGRRVEDLAAEDRATIDRLVAERASARKSRDWARADKIRDELAELGAQITDTPEGTVWTLR